MMKELRNENGIALFLVLWVIVILTVIVGEFCYSMRTRIYWAGTFKEKTQARYIAEAGLNVAISELLRILDSGSDIYVPETELFEDSADKGITWRVNSDIPAIPLGEGRFKARIDNVSGKINLNHANVFVLKMMLNNTGVTDSQKEIIVDSILDWRDRDGFHRANGAEDDYYEHLNPPYQCKDNDFFTKDELLRVRGITPELYYNHLEKLVTVYPGNPKIIKKKSNKNRRKDKYKKKKAEFEYDKININAAPPEVLATLSSMTPELVQAVVDFRKVKDFVSFHEFQYEISTDVYNENKFFITLQTSPFYIIESTGFVDGSNVAYKIKLVIRIDNRLEKRYKVLQRLENL